MTTCQPDLPKVTSSLRLLLAMLCGLMISGRGIAATPTGQAARPNVVVILSDDQGWGDFSLNGNSNLETPHIDQLARDGARLERFYVCPVCSPTRAEFLTGRYHPRGGVYSTSSGGERLDLDEVTIGDTFKAAGYRTAAFGKWHNGMQYPYHPNGRGFEEYYGFCSGHWGHYFSPMLEHNGQIVTGTGYLTDDLTSHAMSFIEQHREEPFFVYLPYNTPHSPMQVPDRWWDKFKDKELALRNRDAEREDIVHTRAALAMCENIDWNVGRLLKTLDELKLADNTIVMYFCDNGPNGVRWNGGMKGRKGSTDEGGVRSPLLVRWPGKIAPGTVVEPIAGAIDLLPTLSDLCNVPLISKQPLDGISIKSALLGKPEERADRSIISHWNRKISVRTQQYRLDQTGKLYDMQADPRQNQDVSAAHPEITSRLKSEAEAFRRDVVANLGQDDRPFVIGHPDYRFTQIPARDAKSHGNIKRSSRHPNCSYFYNWISTDDSITWDVTVDAAGTYEVEVYYACPASDVGSTFELSCHGARLTGQLTVPNDPPVVGAAEDRSPRTESYVKDFRPWKLGRIQLPSGPGTLTLKALDIPGKQAMEFRLLMLTRVE